MILTYKGDQEYSDPGRRFKAKKGDRVEFSEAEAAQKLQDNPDEWEVSGGHVKRNKRKTSGDLQTDGGSGDGIRGRSDDGGLDPEAVHDNGRD
jgi:hypothetical protein